MGKYELLTKHISGISEKSAGKWHIDHKNDGSPEHPFNMPYVEYSKAIDSFIDDVYKFVKGHPDLNLYEYNEILEKNGINWGMESMKSVKTDKMDAKTVLALIMGSIRADRFSEGALLEFIESGCMVRWLLRLKTIDNEAETDNK